MRTREEIEDRLQDARDAVVGWQHICNTDGDKEQVMQELHDSELNGALEEVAILSWVLYG